MTERRDECRKQLDHLISLHPEGVEPVVKGDWYEIYAEAEEDGVYKGNLLVRASVSGGFLWEDRAYFLAEEVREQQGRLVFSNMAAAFSADEDWKPKGRVCLVSEGVTLTLSPEGIETTDGTLTVLPDAE